MMSFIENHHNNYCDFLTVFLCVCIIGNMYKGIRLKWTEPPEARMPPPGWRLYVFKGVEQVETLHLHRQSAYLFGREDIIADIHLLHGSISKQHAVIQFRMKVVS